MEIKLLTMIRKSAKKAVCSNTETGEFNRGFVISTGFTFLVIAICFNAIAIITSLTTAFVIGPAAILAMVVAMAVATAAAVGFTAISAAGAYIFIKGMDWFMENDTPLGAAMDIVIVKPMDFIFGRAEKMMDYVCSKL